MTAPLMPLYQKAKNYIKDSISEGVWKPGDQITSEADLVNRLGMSRMTIHRALRELTSEGLLQRIQGVGTFVAHQRPPSGFLQIKSIAQEINENGGRHRCKVLFLRQERAPEEIRAVMSLPDEAPVFHSLLIHYDRDIPIQLADRFVNPTVAPGYLKQDFSKITPGDYLLKNVPLTEVEHIIEAILTTEEIGLHLNISKHEPCLLMRRITWMHTVVATHSRLIYPGSRYRIGGRFRFHRQAGHAVA
jgi:GntR family histidine utilization transcriptional repressor